MLGRKDLLDENYTAFKAEAEEIISRYQFGTYYKTDMKEPRVDLKEIVALTRGSPMEYLRLCSLYKFLNDFYKIPYVKKIIEYAKERGFSFELPSEIKQQISMDDFSVLFLRKKEQERSFDMQYFCEIIFTKEIDHKKYGVRVPILEYVEGRMYVQDPSSIMASINRLDE
jgi:hypothetical protein